MAQSVVSIVWYFSRPRRDSVGRELIGQRATAWFYTSPKLLVTAAHFANELRGEDWQEVELSQAARTEEPDRMIRVRLRVAVPGWSSNKPGAAAGADLADDVAILELLDPLPGAQVLEIHPDPLPRDAAVLVIGYPRGKRQAARGIVRKTEDAADGMQVWLFSKFKDRTAFCSVTAPQGRRCSTAGTAASLQYSMDC